MRRNPSKVATERLISLRQARLRLGVHRPLEQAVERGDLPAYRFGTWVRLRVSDLEAWVEEHRVEGSGR